MIITGRSTRYFFLRDAVAPGKDHLGAAAVFSNIKFANVDGGIRPVGFLHRPYFFSQLSQPGRLREKIRFNLLSADSEEGRFGLNWY